MTAVISDRHVTRLGLRRTVSLPNMRRLPLRRSDLLVCTDRPHLRVDTDNAVYDTGEHPESDSTMRSILVARAEHPFPGRSPLISING